jgi:hypothetical protein
MIEHLQCDLDLTYNWGYESTRRDLAALTAKAKRSQWLGDDVLPWDTSVDLERLEYPEFLLPLYGSDIDARMTPREKTALKVELAAWLVSQFLHGEQGALMAATQLVATVPDTDGKHYAATQVFDEARHVEVYQRYLHEKIGFRYEVSPHLKKLLDMTLTDTRWDMKLLGMQIMVEGLALAAFGVIEKSATEPLLKKLTHYVMRDEARHVAYGVLSLRDHYRDMKESERNEREDFVYEAALLMRDRFRFEEVYAKLGMPVAECVEIGMKSAGQQMFRQMLFSKIVPALKKMELLSPRQRARFAELGILQFEAWSDPFEDFDA